MTYEMDEKDRKILEILKDNGDYTTRQIAKKTLLPITTVHNRIRKLKQEKIIKKFTIEPDYSKLDKGFMAYVLINVSNPTLREKKKTQYDVVNDLKKFYFIDRIDIVTGGTDMVAIVRVKDVEEYDKVLIEKILNIEGVENTQTLIVIHEQK